MTEMIMDDGKNPKDEIAMRPVNSEVAVEEMDDI
jgi:hypothetical protein